MICKKVQLYLDDYRHDRLEPETRELVRRHLDECPSCRRALEEEEFVSSFLEELKPPDTGDTLASELMKKLTEKEKSARETSRFQESVKNMSPFVRWTIVLSMLAFFAGIGILVFTFQSNQEVYHPTYGKVGYTWMGPATEETEKALSEGSGWGSAMPAVTDMDISGEASQDGQITHVFVLDTEAEPSPVTPHAQKEKQQQ